MKRAIDVALALTGLIALMPLMVMIAMAIVLGDRGTVIFSQSRVGQFGRCFRMYKFRTMVSDAEKKGISLTVGADRRITQVGRWLRRTKLDELPQLWNVVKGDMNLVGPRPEVPHYVAFYTTAERLVLERRPGITDPASLQYFEEADLLASAANPEAAYIQQVMPHKLAINLSYLQRQTIASDLSVILATLWRMAYPHKPTRPPSRTAPQRRAA